MPANRSGSTDSLLQALHHKLATNPYFHGLQMGWQNGNSQLRITAPRPSDHLALNLLQYALDNSGWHVHRDLHGLTVTQGLHSQVFTGP
jgi:hypothetical protein